ncbi:Mss4-like protein [Cladochytrium replicatum]|nr:Mss4-like protein [Cladochytrium replicatum]
MAASVGIELSGSCFCKAVSYSITLPPATELPLPGFYSHSRNIRKLLGFPTAFLFTVPSTSLTLRSPSSSHREFKTDNFTAVFCGVCGASLFNRVGDATVDVHASTLDVEHVRRVVEPKAHMWCSESPTLTAPARFIDDGLPRYAGELGGPLWWKSEDGLAEAEEGETLVGGCGCGGVRFEVKRPPVDYFGDEMLRDWTKRGRRYTAGHCFCVSCRKISGAPFWDWMFVPLKQISFINDSTIQTYTPERDVTRRFCGVCGTHMFFTTTTTDYKLWDVAIGAIDSGPNPQHWLVWKYDSKDNEEGRKEIFCDEYINGWLKGQLSFEEFAGPFCPEILEEVRKGVIDI